MVLNVRMQDASRTTLESLLVPAFEQSCKMIFEEADGAYQTYQHQADALIVALTVKVNAVFFVYL